jgi:hypothetical protein
MTNRQTITGYFNNKAEAQQAVQLLLSGGFTAEHVGFSTQPDSAATSTNYEMTTAEQRSTGRFFTSLFGNIAGSQLIKSGRDTADEVASCGSTTLVTIRVKSALEIDQAVDLLNGAWDVNIRKEEF